MVRKNWKCSANTFKLFYIFLVLSQVLVVYHYYYYSREKFPVLYGPALPSQVGKATFNIFFIEHNVLFLKKRSQIWTAFRSMTELVFMVHVLHSGTEKCLFLVVRKDTIIQTKFQKLVNVGWQELELCHSIFNLAVVPNWTKETENLFSYVSHGIRWILVFGKFTLK